MVSTSRVQRMSSHWACIRQRPWLDIHSRGYCLARSELSRSSWLSDFSIQWGTGGRSGSSGMYFSMSVEEYSSSPVGVVRGLFLGSE